MPMKTRLEEVNEELEHARDDIYSVVININEAARCCILISKDKWSKLDAAVERYAALKIEKAELEKRRW